MYIYIYIFYTFCLHYLSFILFILRGCFLVNKQKYLFYIYIYIFSSICFFDCIRIQKAFLVLIWVLILGKFPHGKHGYSNEYREMWPMFIAYGPAFKKSFKFETDLETIDYYNIMCAILEIDCRPNNGSFKRAHSMLVNVSPLGQKWLKKEGSDRNYAFSALSSKTIIYQSLIISISFMLC